MRAPANMTLAGAVALLISHAATAQVPSAPTAEQRAFGIGTLWRALPARVVPGDGLTAAVIDEGCAPRHPALRGRVAAFEDFVDLANRTPVDSHGHGTAVAATIVGADRRHPGIAPGAGMVCLRVADPFVPASEAVLVHRIRIAMRWVLANHNRLGIRVVNLSVGDRTGRCGVSSPLTAELDALFRAGVLVTVSDGNNGDRAGCAVNSYASDRYALRVGSVHRPDDTRFGFVASAFSSRGPEQAPGFVYGQSDSPTVMAPGEDVTVADPFTGGYVRDSGTSFAAPFVAGTILLLEQLAPTATAAQVRAALVGASYDLGRRGRNRVYGVGVIDPVAAARRLRPDLASRLRPVRFPAERHCEWLGARGASFVRSVVVTARGGPFFAATEPGVRKRPRQPTRLFGSTKLALVDGNGRPVAGVRAAGVIDDTFDSSGYGLAYLTSRGRPLRRGRYVLRIAVHNTYRQPAFDVALDISAAASARCA